MYRGNSNSYSRGRQSSSFRPRSNFRGGYRRTERSLDPRLFVRKAVAINASTVKPTAARFTDYPITDTLKRNIATHGYTVPTPIQEQAIPEIIAGRDIIGIAKTGTGKTGAFLISLINKASLDRTQRVLIVTPTRELANQIRDEFHIFANGTGLYAVTTVGGTNISNQIYSLRRNPQFVIGTPGRLKDLINRRKLDLTHFKNVVLDEVDRMVDIGFLKDITYLISFLPKERQSLFFSATVDNKTKGVLNAFVNNPVTITTQSEDSVENIDQDIVRTPGSKTKIDVLHDLLIQPGFDKVIIFGKTKWGVEKLARALGERGFRAGAIHGNKTQQQRQRALLEFKNNTVKILTATDVASRGLDIDNITHVINFDAPTSYDDYVHRIGRTGRAGKRGSALTFV